MCALRCCHECEPVGHALITVFRDAVYGFMPPVGRWALTFNMTKLSLVRGVHGFVCCLVFAYLVLSR